MKCYVGNTMSIEYISMGSMPACKKDIFMSPGIMCAYNDMWARTARDENEKDDSCSVSGAKLAFSPRTSSEATSN